MINNTSNSESEPKIITVIYSNKAYWTRVYLCFVGMVRFEIFDCRGNRVHKSDIYTDDRTSTPTQITDKALKEIQNFYSEIGLIVPFRNNFIPDLVSISDKIAVIRNHAETYNVVATTDILSERDSGVKLIGWLSYEKALTKAADIAALCR